MMISRFILVNLSPINNGKFWYLSDFQIIDAVVAARILNATLVIPKLDEESFWKDARSYLRAITLSCLLQHNKKVPSPNL